MKIADFIKNEVFLPRVQKSGVLIIYDIAKKYRDIVLEMASDKIDIVDATESSIESREIAIHKLRTLGDPTSKLSGVLVYVPSPKPLSDEEKQKDPFALYATCGDVFPHGDGDEFLSICIKAKPDQATEIRRIFSENKNPDFAVIDAIGGGAGWPNLQTLLRADSAMDILFALLVPTEEQKKDLKASEAWVSEAKDLFASCLGLKLLTRGKTWSSIADELWRFLLFSEFVFDLPEDLPEELKDVPCAKLEARPIIEELCERIRNDQRHQTTYIERAENIQNELALPQHCVQISDLGERDTFAFEERTFLQRAIEAICKNETDVVRKITERHTNTVWVGKGEIQAQWGLIQTALNLIEACEDYERELLPNSRTQETLVDYYVSCLRQVDKYHREFERAINDCIESHSTMPEVIDKSRSCYRNLSNKVQNIFLQHLEKNGWPPGGRVANYDVFNKFVAPKLMDSGKKIAYILIDALRYELGVALEKQLSDEFQALLIKYRQFPIPF